MNTENKAENTAEDMHLEKNVNALADGNVGVTPNGAHIKPKRKRISASGGVVALIVANLIAKVIGAIYRVPLTNVLGAEGMGMYQLVFPVYAFFMVLSTAGIPTAVSRIVAEKKFKGENSKKYLALSLGVLLCVSLLSAVVVAASSGLIARAQGNAATAWGFVAIAPAIVFTGGISGLRGWFQGNLNMIPSAVSNLSEQCVKLAVGLALAVVGARYGVIYGVIGAIVGVVASEIVTLAYLAVTYAVKERGAPKEVLKTDKTEKMELAKVALPIAFVALLMPLGSLFDSVIVVNMLALKGIGVGLATAEYGLLTGPVSSLVNVPIVVTMSIAAAIVPSVSAARSARDLDGIRAKCRVALKTAYVFGIASALVMACWSKEIVALLYPTLSPALALTASSLLMIDSINIALLSAMQIYVALLQALDRTKYAIVALGGALLVRVASMLVLTRYIGILGAAAASVAFGVCALFASLVYFRRLTYVKVEKSVAKGMIVSVIMALVSLSAKYVFKNSIAALCVGGLLALVTAGVGVLVLKVFEYDELEALPFGSKLNKICRKLRFWEN